jgi:hypothetical protein
MMPKTRHSLCKRLVQFIHENILKSIIQRHPFYTLLLTYAHTSTQTVDILLTYIHTNKLYYRSKKHLKLCTESIVRMFLTYTFNKVPIGLFLLVFMSHGTQVTTMRNKHDQKMSDCQKPDWFCYHSLPQHHRSLIIIYIDGWHLVEPLGSATSYLKGISLGTLLAMWVLLYSQTSLKQF